MSGILLLVAFTGAKNTACCDVVDVIVGDGYDLDEHVGVSPGMVMAGFVFAMLGFVFAIWPLEHYLCGKPLTWGGVEEEAGTTNTGTAD